MAQLDNKELADLEAQIRDDLAFFDHVERERARLGIARVQRSLDHGDRLIKIKGKLGHGDWLPWLARFGISQTTARRHMDRAEHRELVEELIEAKSASLEDLTLEVVDAEIARREAEGEDDDGSPEPPPPPPPVLRLHDVVMLGDPPSLAALARGDGPPRCHVLICGDTRTLKVALALHGGKPRMLLCDPPYGIEYKGFDDTEADWRAAWANFPGHHGFVFYEATLADEAIAGLKAVGFKLVNRITWDKRATTGMHLDRGIRRRDEYILYVAREGHERQHWVKGKQLDSPLRCVLGNKERKDAAPHTTPKPIALLRSLIDAASQPGDVILDPFVGSGSTLLAAEKMDRVCLAIEKEPIYCDVAVRRWQRLTGRKAMLWQGGTRDPIPFDDLRPDDGERRQPLVRMLDRPPPEPD